MPDQGPIFLAGIDRSGIGLLGEMLSAHPRIFISRRTRFWTYYHERFGDLRRPENLTAVVDEMLRYTRVTDLQPDRHRLLAEFRAEPDSSGYGTLFALMQQHHLERIGKQRWGDKTLNAERQADAIFREFPTARMIHVIRDPRDRYASQVHHRSASRGKVGAGSALWRSSVLHGKRNLATHRGRYRVIRYEDLVARPMAVLPELCRFIGESFDPQMLRVPSALRSDASSGDSRRIGLVTTSVGRFRRDLTPHEIAFIQLATGGLMRTAHYERVPVPMTVPQRAQFIVREVPLSAMRMVAWWANTTQKERSGGTPSSRRTVAPG